MDEIATFSVRLEFAVVCWLIGVSSCKKDKDSDVQEKAERGVWK